MKLNPPVREARGPGVNAPSANAMTAATFRSQHEHVSDCRDDGRVIGSTRGRRHELGGESGAARIIRRCALCRQADGPVKLGRSALGPDPQVAEHRSTKGREGDGSGEA
jgi:hypothetical protein